METQKILQSDYLDLIYDKRNKQYGGYELRKHYNRRAMKALGLTFSALLLGIGTPFLLGKMNARPMAATARTEERIVEMNHIAMTPVKPAEPVKPKQPDATPPLHKTIQHTVPDIVANNSVKPALKPPVMEDHPDAIAGPANNEGQGGDATAMNDKLPKGPLGNGGSSAGNGGGGAGGGNHKEDEPVKFSEEMPEFPGGMEGLRAYLRSHIQYPLAAREAGIEGKVMVTFVVNKEGKIERATVVRSIGGGCDKEALRVVNAMPAWKPGKQNGLPVKVWYTLPVAFSLGR